MLLSKLKSILAVLALCGCGFSPIYAQKGDNENIASRLQFVKINQIKTVIGQEYVSALEDVLNPSRISAVPEYVINATVTKSVQALAIERDRTVTRFKVIINVSYTMKEIATDKTISSGKIKNEADFDRVTSDYATHVSEQDTASRAIRELAEDTKIRIMAALAKI